MRFVFNFFRGETEFSEEEHLQGAAQHQAGVQDRLPGLQQVNTSQDISVKLCIVESKIQNSCLSSER